MSRGGINTGLTEGHWFEDEYSLSERQLERAIEDEKAAYERGLRDGSAKTGWLRTKDTLPDAGMPVLVYSIPLIEIATIYKVNNDEKVWWLRNVGTMDLRYYKWWMPLPEPPKEG